MSARIIAVAMIALTACVASAKVATISLTRLAQSSLVIVVADVTKIVDRAGTRVAVAKVVQELRGAKANDTLEFVAERTWTCDISSAKAGERVLLFLNAVSQKAGKSMNGQQLGLASAKSAKAGRKLYQLGHSGRGRIVITRDKGGDWVGVERWSAEYEWTLHVNLLAPKNVKVSNTEKASGRPPTNKARITLKDVLTATAKALKLPRIQSRQLEPEALDLGARFCRTKPPT